MSLIHDNQLRMCLGIKNLCFDVWIMYLRVMFYFENYYSKIDR